MVNGLNMKGLNTIRYEIIVVGCCCPLPAGAGFATGAATKSVGARVADATAGFHVLIA